jgi:DNA polymerase I-like protein with 3'-5' exonuclease and polymerase domains
VEAAQQQQLIFWPTGQPEEVSIPARRAGILAPVVHTSDDVPVAGVVLAMGAARLDILKAHGRVPKNRSLDSMRGVPVSLGGSKLMFTYSPGLRHVREDAVDQIVWDIKLSLRLLAQGHTKPVLGDYRWEFDFSELIDEVRGRLESEEFVDLSFDTETQGLYPYYPDKNVVTAQASHVPGRATVVWLLGRPKAELDDVREQMRWLLTNPRIRVNGSNWKYDAVWLAEKFGIERTNLSIDNALVGSILDENRPNGLKWHCKVLTDLGGYDDELHEKYDIAQIENTPRDVLLGYTGGDADGGLRVAQVLRRDLLRQQRLAKFYVTILRPGAQAFERIERRGVCVNQQRMADLRKEVSAYIADTEKTLLTMLPARLRNRHADKIQDQIAKGSSPLTPKILKEFFFDPHYGMGLKPKMKTKKTEEASTAYEHLSMFADDPAVKDFLERYDCLNNSLKMRSTFIDGFLGHLRPDGRFHPSYAWFNGDLFDSGEEAGTTTGRSSTTGPAIQTQPKHLKRKYLPAWAKKLRYCYDCPPGMLFWQRDFNQGELRIAGALANEKVMIASYAKGMDLHAVTGAGMAKATYEEFVKWKVPDKLLQGLTDPDLLAKNALYVKYRQEAKAGNFGLLYTMSPDGFVDYAWKNYGIKLTLAEARKIHDSFFETYPGLHPWHEAYRNYAHKHGFVESPLGRVRHLPLIHSRDREVAAKAERQAINSPVQATLSDLCVWGIALIDQKLPDLWVAGMTHDSVYGYVHEDDVERVMPLVGEIMDGLPYRREFGWESPIEFPTDLEVGPNMRDLVKM